MLFCTRGTGAADIKLDSRFYYYVEELASDRLVESHLFGTRPFSLNEARRLSLEAATSADVLSGQGIGREPRLKALLDDTEAVAYYGGDFAAPRGKPAYDLSPEPVGFFFKPIAMPRLEFAYLDGEKASFPGVNAAQNALLYNNEGIDFEKGYNTYLSFETEATAGPLSVYLEPLFYADGGTHGRLQTGHLTLSGGNLDLQLGKRSLWWGQGHHGGLFLTNNAEPLPMVRLTNPSPTILPSIFERLGPFRFDTFLSLLEEERDVPKPYLFGLRFDFKPHPALEVGLTRMTMMGGEGRPGITPSRFVEIMVGDNLVGDKELSNSIAGVDTRLTLPFGQVYAEWGGEDEAHALPTHHAYLGGVYLPLRKVISGLRFEYADLSHESDSSPDWYFHKTYTSGYTYMGRLLGHHVGGGGRDYFLEATLVDASNFKAKVHLDYEERGIDRQPANEKHTQVGTEIEWWRQEWRLRLGLAYETISNADYEAGSDESSSLASLHFVMNL